MLSLFQKKGIQDEIDTLKYKHGATLAHKDALDAATKGEIRTADELIDKYTLPAVLITRNGV